MKKESGALTSWQLSPFALILFGVNANNCFPTNWCERCSGRDIFPTWTKAPLDKKPLQNKNHFSARAASTVLPPLCLKIYTSINAHTYTGNLGSWAVSSWGELSAIQWQTQKEALAMHWKLVPKHQADRMDYSAQHTTEFCCPACVAFRWFLFCYICSRSSLCFPFLFPAPWVLQVWTGISSSWTRLHCGQGSVQQVPLTCTGSSSKCPHLSRSQKAQQHLFSPSSPCLKWSL